MSAYEPIYAAPRSGTNTDARLQLSFKYQLFGSHARQDGGLFGAGRPSILALHTAYVLGSWRRVPPFRNIDYQPELFYLSPGRGFGIRQRSAGQTGVRHVNPTGVQGDASRSVNGFYLGLLRSLFR
ncbi:MAG: phospholipase A [Sphingomonadales bacterium]|nr:phospholipase A [Sphingomonadales bacterium]